MSKQKAETTPPTPDTNPPPTGFGPPPEDGTPPTASGSDIDGAGEQAGNPAAGDDPAGKQPKGRRNKKGKDAPIGQDQKEAAANPTGAPVCPYCKVPTKATSSQSIFTYYACPEPGCPYTAKVTRPNARKRLARAEAAEPINPHRP